MKDVVFKPYQGSKYTQNNRFGLRVLVLGESHNHDGVESSDFTTGVVKWFTQNKRDAFFTKIAKVLLGIETNGWLSDTELVEIWDQVAFYNYIQCFVKTARIRPTDEMWRAAQEPFLSVLDELKPDVVLVLGFDLLNHLGQPLPEGPEFCGIKHPSTGFSYREWTPKFVDALNKAKEKATLRV